MPKSATFAPPRSYLEAPGFFGKHEDVIWKLARNLEDALHLARVREQHELSYQILRLELLEAKGVWAGGACTTSRGQASTLV